MSNDENGPRRRRVLQLSSATIAGIVGFSGATSANPGKGRGRGGGEGRGPPGHANAPDFVQERNGRIELTVEESDWNSTPLSEVEGIPDGARPIPYEAIEDAVSDFNQAIADGRLSLGWRNDHSVLAATGNGVGSKGGDE